MSLNLHITKMHGGQKRKNTSTKLYECDICGISAPKSHLKIHQQLQHAKFDCNICKKTLKDLRNRKWSQEKQDTLTGVSEKKTNKEKRQAKN